LNEKQKNIITLTKIEGYTNKEVAGKLGMTETSVKVAGHRAMKKLKEHTQKQADSEKQI
jgi:RNA polymerase sigma factor (sigma-70 family)